MADLFQGCSDDEVELKTDNSYAKRYDEWRRKEELMKAKARFGSDLEDSSSDDEDEDNDASLWTAAHEKQFLTTLSAIKARDPKIYNKDEIIFPEISTPLQEKANEKSSESNKMTLKDYERKIITTEGGIYADEEDEDQQRRKVFEETRQDQLAYDDEQRQLRDSLKQAAWSTGDQDDDDNILVTKKNSSKDEQKRDEEEYIKWLKGETKKLSNKKDAKDLATLKQLWSSEGEKELDQAERFLRDYVLDRKYLTPREDDYPLEVDLSEDEKDVAALTEFEHKYNFRFEDPDPDFIKRYPRTIEDSMRRKDLRRVDRKAEKKTRKEQLKIQLKEEVNRLKSFKKKEISDKIEKLKAIAGSDVVAFEDKDIEGDFDPDEHDKRMASLFASYDNEAGEDLYPELGENEHEDLQWENWDEYEVHRNATNEKNDPRPSASATDDSEEADDSDTNAADNAEGSNDTDDDSRSEENRKSVNPVTKTASKVHGKKVESDHTRDDDTGIQRNEAGKLLVRGKKSAKLTLADVLPERSERKRKKSRFAQVIAEDKPVFDPEKDESFQQYFDEYYKLDFEDVVAGMPTRFKYRQVVPNDFGLSTEEVLQAQDKELNKWCSLKKMVQFRSTEEEKNDLKVFSKRRDHLHLKKKILTSVYTADEEKMDEEIAKAAGRVQDPLTKKSKSRKNKKKKTTTAAPDNNEAGQTVSECSNVAEEDQMEGEEIKKSPTASKKRKAEFSSSIPRKKMAKKPRNATSKLATKAEEVEPSVESSKGSPEEKLDELEGKSAASIPWDQLTPKQKKNRRNAMIKKRKKLEQKQLRSEKVEKKSEKFKPLEDLQISKARLKAYGLNPNRVKGSLVYGKNKNKSKQV